MSEHCGSVTADGAAVCVPGACSCSTETKSSAPILLALPSAGASKNTNSLNGIAFKDHQEQTMWQKIRSGVMFGVACITSPCCTPILVPIGLALLAGTPVAAWISVNVGWVYAGLTLLSVISLVLGFRLMGQKNETKRKRIGQPLPESNH
jgi:Flp pilus assembly protein TadB